ncbi:hypothetical protein LCGC14_3029280, partial [marine sediment metagenome]
NRRGVKRYELDGERLTIGEWAERFDIPHDRLYQRVVRYGWDLGEALETPVARNVEDANDLYGRWHQMIDRCHTPHNAAYANYGGRGIRVCARWRESFDAFATDVGLPSSPQTYTLDRINNDGNYEPGNVRWVSPTTQSRNKRTTKFHELDGEQHTLAQWAELAGIDYNTVRRRVYQGWVLKEALGTPKNVGRSPKARRAWHPKAVLDDAHEKWKSLDDDERLVFIDRILKTYRVSGFPWGCLADQTRDPIESVRRSLVVVEENVVRKVGYAGQRTCLDSHRHRLEARHSASRHSVVSAFDDDLVLFRALRYQLRRGEPITPRRVVRALSALVRGPLNFPPSLARWIVDEFAPVNGTVFD